MFNNTHNATVQHQHTPANDSTSHAIAPRNGTILFALIIRVTLCALALDMFLHQCHCPCFCFPVIERGSLSAATHCLVDTSARAVPLLTHAPRGRRLSAPARSSRRPALAVTQRLLTHTKQAALCPANINTRLTSRTNGQWKVKAKVFTTLGRDDSFPRS